MSQEQSLPSLPSSSPSPDTPFSSEAGPAYQAPLHEDSLPQTQMTMLGTSAPTWPTC